MGKITDTYSGELNVAQAAALTRLTNSQFTPVLVWGRLEKIGTESTTTADGKHNEYYLVRTYTNKPHRIVQDAIEFVNRVKEGTAIQLAGTTTVAP